MPINPTYPGVYVEEIPSGVRTITGVATSITAFIGFAAKGPVNEPVRIQNFGDFERQFGGLSLKSTMSYAVQQFFLNGGSDAIIVRLSNPGAKATVELKAGSGKLILETKEVGDDELKVSVTHGSTDSQFTLTVARGSDTPETIDNLTVDNVVEELNNRSKLVLVKGSKPPSRPNEIADKKFEGGKAKGIAANISLPISKNTEGEAISGSLILKASSEGNWGNNLQATVDYDTANPDDKQMFNLTVQHVEGEQVATEKLRNLSIDTTSTRYIVEVLKAESTFVRVDGSDIPPGRPDKTSKPILSDKKGRDGGDPTDDRFYIGSRSEKTGLYALEKADLFNLLCIPPVSRNTDISPSTWIEALAYCEKRRAMLLVDPPSGWTSKDLAAGDLKSFLGGFSKKQNAAIFFPRVQMADPLKENRLDSFPPSAAIAGVFARTDANRGVWKAPAGTEATLTGVRGLTVNLTDGENGQLNPLGVNCLRSFPVYGNVIWGARTLDGDDRLASEWKYIPVRRLALFLQESLYRGTQWVVFEPNDEPLWAQIRLNLGAFMNNLFRQGAFQGKTPKEAYFVKCDSETTTQNDINLGIVNIVIGFAPLKPAEFVILKFQQMAGQIAV